MRICAGGLLVQGDEMLLAKRSAERAFYPGVWDVIGGHCADGEAPADTLVREVKEEIGVTPCAFEEVAVLAEPDPAKHALALPLAHPEYGKLFRSVLERVRGRERNI